MSRIVQATFEDLPRLARCHRVAFPKTLSTAMGQKYVEKMLEWYLVDDRAFIFLLEEDDQCVGYCGGLKFDGNTRVGSASSMIQHSFNAAAKAILIRPWLLVHSEFVSKYGLALKNIWRRLTRDKQPSLNSAILQADSVEPHAGLVVIGIDPTYQGKGYGSRLLQEFEAVAKKMGFAILKLTVKSTNATAIKSYQRNGWSIVNDDRKSVTMTKKI
ncbi:MAG: GNAT family N-acetyltransferase [Cyclobacteriaceae bacterium]|nr:MAG: GNAT family N-acetyltransferase [Cyclobacteriaceae bacterium]